MAECAECGAISTTALDRLWQQGIIVCECGIEMVVLPVTFEILEDRAKSAQERIHQLLQAN